MVGYSKRSLRGKRNKGVVEDKENQPSYANQPTQTPITNVPPPKRKASSLTKTASRISALSKPKRTPPIPGHTVTVPKTSPPRLYSGIETVGDDPFQILRDLPRTPAVSHMHPDTDGSISPISSMYRIAIEENVDLIELGPTEDTRFISPILSRNNKLSPISSPVKPFVLPMSPNSPSSTTTISITAHEPHEEKPDAPLPIVDESHMSHLSEVSLATTPQKQLQVLKLQKSVSTFDVRAGSSTGVGVCIGAAAGSISATTPKKVVIMNVGKKKQTFSPQENLDLSFADMLHDLSYSTNKSDEGSVIAEDIAEVSKEEFLWGMKNGADFLKHGRRGKPHKRMVWFDIDLGAICWTNSGKKKKVKPKQTMKLQEIVDIIGGTVTPVFLRRSPNPSVCFSIVAQKRTLDLECNDEQVRDFWMSRFYLLKILQNELQAST